MNTTEKVEQFFSKANSRFGVNLPCDIRNRNQCPCRSTDLIELILTALREAELVEGKSTGREKVLLERFHRQMRDVNSLAQALGGHSKGQMRKRTYPPELVDNLLYQLGMLTSTLVDFVIPRLEQIDNNRK